MDLRGVDTLLINNVKHIFKGMDILYDNNTILFFFKREEAIPAIFYLHIKTLGGYNEKQYSTIVINGRSFTFENDIRPTNNEILKFTNLLKEGENEARILVTCNWNYFCSVLIYENEIERKDEYDRWTQQ